MQESGIESLVDELCVKLKEINQSAVDSEPVTSEKSFEITHSSPQDLAKRYYAAFPSLNKNSRQASPTNYVTLIPKWFGSPKKKLKRQNRSYSYEDKFHKIDSDCLKSRAVGKQRCVYFSKNKKDLGYCRNVAKSMERSEGMNDWDFYMFQSNTKPASSNNCPKQSENSEETEKIWIDDAQLSMYDDLQVNIRQLLNSPTPLEEENAQSMNVANMTGTVKKNFLSCGYNLTNSIWSNNASGENTMTLDNNFNAAIERPRPSDELDLKFSSISIDNSKSNWRNPELITDNERNAFYEDSNPPTDFPDEYSINNVNWEAPLEKWSDGEGDVEMFERSLEKINHNNETSSFVEVRPRPNRGAYEVFNSASRSLKISIPTIIQNGQEDAEDDLLSSDFTHFEPINTFREMACEGIYSDGTTFKITSNLERPNFKRSDSGTTYLHDESGLPKKYQEFKGNCAYNKDLLLKFRVSLNDKGCQTEFNDSERNSIRTRSCSMEQFFTDDDDAFPSESKPECTCPRNKDSATDLDCPIHLTGPDSETAEIFRKENIQCDNCKNNAWNTKLSYEPDLYKAYDRDQMNRIWNGDFCRDCWNLVKDNKAPLTVQRYCLLEEAKHDGEQLFSDLRAVVDSIQCLPISEVNCCNISERIRRASQENAASHISYRFPRIEEDVLINVTALPALRALPL